MPASFFNTTNDAVLATGSRAFAALVSADPARYQVSQQEADDYAAVDAIWQAAYAAANHPGMRCVSLTTAKNSARDVVRPAAASLGGRINADFRVSDADRARLGLSVRATRTPIGPPGTPYRIGVTFGVGGVATLTWQCDQPRGARGTLFNVYRRVRADGPLTFLGVTGKRRFVDSGVPADVTQLSYRVQAARSTAKGDPAEHVVRFGSTDNRPLTPDTTRLRRTA